MVEKVMALGQYPQLTEILLLPADGIPPATEDYLPTPNRTRGTISLALDDPLHPTQGLQDSHGAALARCWEDVGTCSSKPEVALVQPQIAAELSFPARQLGLTSDLYYEYLREHLWKNGYQKPSPVSSVNNQKFLTSNK